MRSVISKVNRLHFFQDFCFTVVIAVFWLSASAAWANGVSNLKFVVDPDNWLVQPTGASFCKDATKAVYGVQSCEALDRGRFGGANGSVVSCLTL